jgi:hypothetical protein
MAQIPAGVEPSVDEREVRAAPTPRTSPDPEDRAHSRTAFSIGSMVRARF